MTVKKTILCVDDEHSLSIHKVTLETRGYRVLACGTAAEAMNILARGGVDLILSNLELPDVPPPELVSRIRAHWAEMPLVLLSGSKRSYAIDGAVELLRKGSYAPAFLLERIRLLLTKRRGPRRIAAAEPGFEEQRRAC
jgi:two-component system, OmpR family, response regulator CpxR